MPAHSLVVRQQRQAISDRKREQIIRMVVALGKTKAETAKFMGRPYSTVSTVVQAFLDKGKTSSSKKKGGAYRGSVVNEEHVQLIIGYVNDRPAATLNEINTFLVSRGGPSISQSHMSRILIDRCHLTLKRI